MKIKKSNFGELKDGSQVVKYHLENDELQVNILNYGGIITEIYLTEENKENLVLGFDNIRDYEEKSPHFGCITGRVAGRLAYGKLVIDGEEYKLDINNGVNNIHGGIKGLDKRIWDVEELEDGIELSYRSPHMEEGFPGEVEFRVRYTLEGSRLRVDYSGDTDRKTFINLTNHTYFNLSGGRENILGHDLTVDADEFVELDENSLPTGVKKCVEGSVFDRRRGGRLSGIAASQDCDISIVGGGFDHPFVLNKRSETEVVLEDGGSGRRLEISTSEPVAVIYTGNFLKDEGRLSNGAVSSKYMGICVETQDYPDAPNQDMVETRYTTPEIPYRAWTVFGFKKA